MMQGSPEGRNHAQDLLGSSDLEPQGTPVPGHQGVHRQAVPSAADRLPHRVLLAVGPIDFEEGSDVILAIAELTPREELAEARDELVLLAERGRRLGLRGRMRAEDHLLEILIGRSPRMAARLRARVLAPLADLQHGELLRTVHALVSCQFDRAATSAALHVHRNTLAYRLRRIEEITGLDLDDPRALALVYLASCEALPAESDRRPV